MPLHKTLLSSFVVLLLFAAAARTGFTAGTADGVYKADYVIVQADNDSVSMANDYFEKPATITVTGGAAVVQLQVNHSKWITEVKAPSGGSYTDAAVVSSDTAADTRVLKFAVADIMSPTVMKIHVTVPDIDYDHDYSIRMVVDQESLTALEQSTKPPEAADAEPAAAASAATAAPEAKPAATAAPAAAAAEAAPAKETASSGNTASAAASGAVGTTAAEGNKQAAAPTSSSEAPPAETVVEAGDNSPSPEVAAAPESSTEPSAAPTETSAESAASLGEETGDAEDGSSNAAEPAEEGSGEVALAAGETAEEQGNASASTWAPLIAALLVALGASVIVVRSRKAKLQKAATSAADIAEQEAK